MGHVKRNSALAAAVATAATFAIAPGAQAMPDPAGQPGDSGTLASVGRIAGIDRIQTAVEASKAMVRQAKGGTVIIAGALQFPDALAAAPLADVLNAPILLTYQNSLDPRVRAEIVRRAAAHVIIVGGEGTVGRAVADALATIPSVGGADNVDRIGGANRYETAYDIAAETAAAYTRAGAQPPGSADSVPAAAQLAQFNQVLQDLIQAQEELAAAQANYGTVSAAYAAALNRALAASAAYKAAQQAVTDIAKKLIVPGTAYTDAQIAAQQAVVTNLVNAYNAKVSGLAFLSRLSGQGGLDLKATLAQYRALSTVDDAALDAAAAAFGLPLTSTLENALSVATVATDAANAAITPEATKLSDMLAFNAQVAANNAANAAVLKQLEAANAQLAAAKKEFDAAQTALAAAQVKFNAAKARLLAAITNAPAPGEVAHATDAVAVARARVVRAAGNRSVFAARGDIFPDALSAGPAAAQKNGVVLLTAGSSAGYWTTKYVNESHAQIVTVGGSATTALGSRAHQKIVGTDRYDTARDVANAFWKGFEPVAVASGTASADAVVAGAFIANHDGALLLTDGYMLSQPTHDYLAYQSHVSAVRVFGGSAVISNGVVLQIRLALNE